VISFGEAFKTTMGSARLLGTEHIGIIDNDALNRALREDVASDIDMPPFNKSAMDGYACRRADLGGELLVIETVATGVQPKKTIGPGQSSKIMTGAVVPDGADCVIMVEYTKKTGENTIRFTGEGTQDNICLRGEDVKEGEVILKAGQLIRSEGLKKTRNAMLSRGIAGIRAKTLIINLPGSPKGARESLEAILDVLPHARDMLLGRGH